MKTFSILSCLLFLLLCSACEKDIDLCSENESFCSFVTDENFGSTGEIINDFLAGLDEGKKDENLELLKDWLACKSCVNNAVIFCNSCIQTLPEQSELTVEFVIDGAFVSKTLDISMGEPLTFRKYH